MKQYNSFQLGTRALGSTIHSSNSFPNQQIKPKNQFSFPPKIPRNSSLKKNKNMNIAMIGLRRIQICSLSLEICRSFLRPACVCYRLKRFSPNRLKKSSSFCSIVGPVHCHLQPNLSLCSRLTLTSFAWKTQGLLPEYITSA